MSRSGKPRNRIDMYKALRVPIPLLHQKCYDTSVRLEKREAVKIEKPSTPLILPASTNSDWEQYLTPVLRRAFYKKQRILHCRVCNSPCARPQDRTDHYIGGCRDGLSYVITRLWRLRMCSVCRTPIDPSRPTGDSARDAIPVCSDKCLAEWDGGNPDLFVDEMVKYFMSKAD